MRSLKEGSAIVIQDETDKAIFEVLEDNLILDYYGTDSLLIINAKQVKRLRNFLNRFLKMKGEEV